MGHSQAEKAISRERILSEAARQIRDGGLESVSVGTLMQRVGLTHGGFYGHFESRSALLTEALERALREGGAKLADAETRPAFPDIVRGYLSPNHRDARDSGCAIAALVSDVARADPAPRDAMATQVESFISAVSMSLGGEEERAILAVSAMVGALALSRVLPNPDRSNAVLESVAAQLANLQPGPSS